VFVWHEAAQKYGKGSMLYVQMATRGLWVSHLGILKIGTTRLMRALPELSMFAGLTKPWQKGCSMDKRGILPN